MQALNQSANATSANCSSTDDGNDVTDNVCEQSASSLDCWERRLWQVVAPIIIIIGLLGNLLVIIVFKRLNFSKSSTLVHMFILAVTDSIVLCLGPLRYWVINTFDLDIRAISNGGCKLHLFLLYTTLGFSAWILVSVTVERALSIFKPLHTRGCFTVKRTVIKLSIILLTLTLINGHYFFSNGLVADAEDVIQDSSSSFSTIPSQYTIVNLGDDDNASTLTSSSGSEKLSTVITSAGRFVTDSTTSLGNSTLGAGLTRDPVVSSTLPSFAVTTAVSPSTWASSLNNIPSLSTTQASNATNVLPKKKATKNSKKGEYNDNESSSYSCDSLTPAWEHFEEFYFVYIDMCVESFLPFLIMAVCNSFIVASLKKHKRNRPRGTTKRDLLSSSATSLDAPAKVKTRSSETLSGSRSRSNSRSRSPFVTSNTRGNATGMELQACAFSSVNETKPHWQNGHVRIIETRANGKEEPCRPKITVTKVNSVGEEQMLTGNGHALPLSDEWDAGYTNTQKKQKKQKLNVPINERLASPKIASGPSQRVDGIASSNGVTRMLVLVTSVFLFTTLPACIYYIVDSYVRDNSDEEARVNKILNVSQAVTNLLSYCNYGCNFLLYSLHSKRFLMEVKYMFGCVSHRTRRYFNSSMFSHEHASRRSRSISRMSLHQELRRARTGHDRQSGANRVPNMPDVCEVDRAHNGHIAGPLASDVSEDARSIRSSEYDGGALLCKNESDVCFSDHPSEDDARSKHLRSESGGSDDCSCDGQPNMSERRSRHSDSESRSTDNTSSSSSSNSTSNSPSRNSDTQNPNTNNPLERGQSKIICTQSKNSDSDFSREIHSSLSDSQLTTVSVNGPIPNHHQLERAVSSDERQNNRKVVLGAFSSTERRNASSNELKNVSLNEPQHGSSNELERQKGETGMLNTKEVVVVLSNLNNDSTLSPTRWLKTFSPNKVKQFRKQPNKHHCLDRVASICEQVSSVEHLLEISTKCRKCTMPRHQTHDGASRDSTLMCVRF